MLSNRLQKLEKDLNLISTIKDILTSDEEGLVNLQDLNLRHNFPQEVPERDNNNQLPFKPVGSCNANAKRSTGRNTKQKTFPESLAITNRGTHGNLCKK